MNDRITGTAVMIAVVRYADNQLTTLPPSNSLFCVSRFLASLALSMQDVTVAGFICISKDDKSHDNNNDRDDWREGESNVNNTDGAENINNKPHPSIHPSIAHPIHDISGRENAKQDEEHRSVGLHTRQVHLQSMKRQAAHGSTHGTWMNTMVICGANWRYPCEWRLWHADRQRYDQAPCTLSASGNHYVELGCNTLVEGQVVEILR
uniref:Uncharacterized protein n=1 Tax=Setaria digitata TaxID=48799 RepID=A0A915PYA9_9BILA